MLSRRAFGPIVLSVICLIVGGCNASPSPMDAVTPRTIMSSITPEPPHTPPDSPATPTSMATSDHPPGQSGVSLAFTTIVQGAAPGGKEVMPFLRLVRTDAQRAALAAQLSTLDRPRLDAVDLSSNVVIA